MPQHVLRSAAHAVAGLHHALRTERNLRLFVAGYSPLIAVAFLLPLTAGEWLALVLAGGTFLSVELLNTGLERLADCLDDHCKREHRSHCFTVLRHTKDIAAAASLISLLVVIAVICVIFIPHLTALPQSSS